MSYAVAVPFAGSAITAVLDGSRAFVAMRPIVEGMGLDWSRQLKKLKEHPVLAKQLCSLKPEPSTTDSTVALTPTVALDGKERAMVCLPVSRLSFWLATVNPNKVRDTIRERVILFQEQCADVLHAALTQQGHDRQQAIADKRAAARLVTDILQEARAEQGKPTAPHHFSNEHRLCNAALTGRFAPVDETALNTAQAACLAAIRRRDALLIAKGTDYPSRKTALMVFARAILPSTVKASQARKAKQLPKETI